MTSQENDLFLDLDVNAWDDAEEYLVPSPDINDVEGTYEAHVLNNWPDIDYAIARPFHHSIYPWRNYRYIRYGDEGYDRDPVQLFIALCANYHKLPDLIWCKIYYSDLDDADINFLSSFAYQNRGLFSLDDLIDCILYVNPNANRDREWDRLYTLGFMQRQLGRSYSLRRRCYAYCITYGHVLNLNNMPRGAVGSEFGPPSEATIVGDRVATDRCLPFYLEYQHMFDITTDIQMAALEINELDTASGTSLAPV